MSRIRVTTSVYVPRVPSGRWWVHPGPQSTAQFVANKLYCIPMEVWRPGALDRLGNEVTVVGSVGSVIRLGVYADDGGGLPGALLVDAGTIDGTSATNQAVALASVVPVFGRVFLASVEQGNPVTAATLRSANTNIPGAQGNASTTPPTTLVAGYSESGTATTGALPGTFPAFGTASSVPSVRARFV